MKVLVLSDTHGKSDLALLSTLADQANLVIHLGDGYADGERLSILTETRVIQITGNVDYPLEVIPEKMLTLEGRLILLTHGHLYGVKNGFGHLVRRAQEIGAGLVLYGHTHQRNCLNLEGVTLLNPGSAALSGNAQPSVGFLQLEGETVEWNWLDLKKN